VVNGEGRNQEVKKKSRRWAIVPDTQHLIPNTFFARSLTVAALIRYRG
jgi:hypothetical protein